MHISWPIFLKLAIINQNLFLVGSLTVLVSVWDPAGNIAFSKGLFREI